MSVTTDTGTSSIRNTHSVVLWLLEMLQAVALRLYVKTTNCNSYIFVQSLSQLTSLELDFNRCDSRYILTTTDFGGGGFPYGGDSIS